MAYTTVDDGSEYFHTQLYTGTGSTNAITNDANAGDFKPDWLWIKQRNTTRSNRLINSSFFSTYLASDTTGAEASNDVVDSLDTDGFTLSTPASVNQSSGTYVAWQWKANGGTTSSNTDGSITSTVQANTTAGFSIVTYTSAAGGQTIGHGLGVKPDMYIIKERTTSGDDWFVYHSALGAGKKLRLSGTSAAESDTNIWQNTEPTSTIAYLQNDGGGVNQNTGGNQNYVGYFFNSVKGYSKFGSYTGNGANDGPFVYTGFKPAWLMTKRTDSTSNWVMHDNTRDPLNESLSNNNGSNARKNLYANLSNAEDSSRGVNFYSNSFKVEAASSDVNGSGATYIYMAFAEHPFVSSKGVPVTAR